MNLGTRASWPSLQGLPPPKPCPRPQLLPCPRPRPPLAFPFNLVAFPRLPPCATAATASHTYTCASSYPLHLVGLPRVLFLPLACACSTRFGPSRHSKLTSTSQESALPLPAHALRVETGPLGPAGCAVGLQSSVPRVRSSNCLRLARLADRVQRGNAKHAILCPPAKSKPARP